ncbi:MAG TPA: hypothetical protein EYP59_00455 [Thiotrichaceae bacterium]|nr:hypothetical protein [Thiotrichaceae bacterium]
MSKYSKVLYILLLWVSAGKSPADVPTDYYTEAIGKTGVALKSALHNIIANHNRYSYKKVWNILQETDEDPNNANNVILIYSRQSLPKSKYGGQVGDWNREHTWPKSHGFPQAGWPAYTDVHHLRPSLVTVNTARGILDFDNGGYKALPEAPLVKYDDDSWEVPNEVKGDIARGLFYMAVRYEGEVDNEPDLELTDNVNESQPNTLKIGKLLTLLEWHLQDPPNEPEQLRNDKIFKWQGNRNPFIDHPEWVTEIWETELTINNGMRFNASQQALSTTANFVPVISLKNEQQSAYSISITQTDTITIEMMIEVDEIHISQMAALLILVYYKNDEIEQWYMRNEQSWQIWDGNFFTMANVAAELRMALSDVESLVVFEGNFQGMPGDFTIYVGYALPEGLIIFNGKKPFQFSVQ